MRTFFLFALAGSVLAMNPVHGATPSGTESSPSVDTLIAADRAFAAAAIKTDGIAALTAQFADDVIMPVPGKGFARSKSDAMEAFNARPDMAGSHIEWWPLGGGVSSDASQGFTYGFMVERRADGQRVPLKYLSYWRHDAQGWRVIAYKRGRRADSQSARLSVVELSAPLTSAGGRTIRTETDRMKNLADAELAFSDEAQLIGLGPAFEKYGTKDSINLGGPADADFVRGAKAISKTVSQGQPEGGSALSWAADERVVVAASDDLGLSVGYIRHNAKAEDGSEHPPIPFFTVWRRAAPDQPWRYVAE